MIIGLVLILISGVTILIISQGYSTNTIAPENYVAGSEGR